MRRVIYLFIFMIIALVLPVFLLVSCTKDEGTGPLTDSSSWEVLTTGELEVPGAVWALDTDEAIVGADNEHIYLTEDNGYNWTTKTLDTETGRNATDFYFIPGGNGIMIGERGMIYVSTDEGQNWTDATPSEMRDENLYDIIYPSDGSGNPLFVVGDDGALLRSTNYGITWEMISFDTLFYSDTLGNSSWYYDTTTFESQKFIDFHGGFAPNSNLIYILADTSTTDRKVILFRSTTGDADDWDTLAINTPLTLVDLYMSDDNSGFTISDDGYVYPITIDSTTVTLDPMPAADIGRALKEIEFIDDNTGWVVGASGAVARTSDGGENWEEIDVDITGDVYDIAFADADQGWQIHNQRNYWLEN